MRQGLGWRSWSDDEGRILEQYEVKHIPAFILIDDQGVVRDKMDHPDADRLERAIELLLRGAPGA